MTGFSHFSSPCEWRLLPATARPAPTVPICHAEDWPDPGSPSPHPSHQTTLQCLAHVTQSLRAGTVSHPCVPSTSAQPASPDGRHLPRGWTGGGERLPHTGLRCSWETGRQGPTHKAGTQAALGGAE